MLWLTWSGGGAAWAIQMDKKIRLSIGHKSIKNRRRMKNPCWHDRNLLSLELDTSLPLDTIPAWAGSSPATLKSLPTRSVSGHGFLVAPLYSQTLRTLQQSLPYIRHLPTFAGQHRSLYPNSLTLPLNIFHEIRSSRDIY